MKRKIVAGLLSLCVLSGLLPTAVMAEEVTAGTAEREVVIETQEGIGIPEDQIRQEGDYKYNVLPDGTVRIVEYVGNDVQIVIPAELGGYSVTVIEWHAFYGCNSLDSITISEGITEIGESAFADCGNLRSVSIPGSVIYISGTAFLNCNNLEEIIISESNEEYCVDGNVLFNKDKDRLMLMACLDKNVTDYVVPEGVTRIGYDAFSDCRNLKNIVIPGSVIHIYAGAFSDCSSLESITIPEGVTHLGGEVFSGCSSLSSITIPESVDCLFPNAFEGCSSLKNIVIPGSVKGIYDRAFADCSSLESITLSEGLEWIGSEAFAGCSSLSGITIPNSVERLLGTPFTGCNITSIFLPENVFLTSASGYSSGETLSAMNNLENIEVAETNRYYCSIDGVLFSKDKGTLVAYPQNKKGNEYIIPEGTLTIGEDAFYNCSSLESIIIPEGMLNMEWNAFYGCSSIECIKIPGSVTLIGSDWSNCARSFGECSNLESIEVAETNENYCSIDGVLYNKNKDKLLFYPQNKKGEEYIVPNGVKEIWREVFVGCSNLRSIKIPGSVASIGDSLFKVCDAFEDCSNLESIEVDQSNGNYCSIDGILFNKNKNELIEYPQNKKGEEYIIPKSVKKICNGAFSSCSNLNSIMIPKGVTEIEYSAFSGAGSLTDVYYEGSSEEWEKITVNESNEELLSAEVHFNHVIDYPQSDPLFNDVYDTDWFYNSVSYVNVNGLMTGLNETTFGPSQNLARAQFAVILHRINDEPKVYYTEKFPDVAANLWYTDAILWASDTGVVTGYSSTGMFGPGDNINREQMAVMMYRYANYMGYDTSMKEDFSRFNDAAKVNDFAKEAMQWAVGNGIITGKNNGTTLDPQGNASRAECATIIMRFMEKYGK